MALIEQLTSIARVHSPAWNPSTMSHEQLLDSCASRIVLAACAALELGATAVRIEPGESARLRVRFEDWHTLSRYPAALHPRVVALFRGCDLLDVRYDACAAGERVLIQGRGR